MIVLLIAAVTENYGLGKDGDLLHKCPIDMQHFKEVTEGSIVIMGRKTWESLPAFLPNRINLVVGSKEGQFASLEDALAFADTVSENPTVFIIGGAKMYKEALDLGIVGGIYLTRFGFVDTEADTYFPWESVLMNKTRIVPLKGYRTYLTDNITVPASIEEIMILGE